MIRSKRVNGYSDNAVLSEFYGLSTDTKPTENVATGSVFLEVDTGKTFLYDEEGEDWTEVENGSSGGGGGGDSDFSTAMLVDLGPNSLVSVTDLRELCYIVPTPAGDLISALPRPYDLTPDGLEYKIVLYKGSAETFLEAETADAYTITVTGDIICEYSEDEGGFIISIRGDGAMRIIAAGE